MNPIKLLFIPGSLRKNSFNKALARFALNNLPEGVTGELFELNDIPLYNGDVEDRGYPESVLKLFEKFTNAHGIVFVTPEYNRSVPGVLKNTIDWLSRKPLFKFKPVSIMGASDGPFATVRAQLILKPILIDQEAIVMGKPEVVIPMAPEKFDENLNLTDEKAKEKVIEQLMAFKEFILKVN